MNFVKHLSRINGLGKFLVLAVLVANLVSIISAEDQQTVPGGGILNATRALCMMAQQFLGLAAMLLVVLAGAVYGIGQVLGAETRARAAVWATAMLTGAIIGIIIFVVAPYVISIILQDQSMIKIEPGNPCGAPTTE